jgi:ABC-2 type transport system ATP-binding protein/lipopolysaccharide transport system ATP-binding protein
MSLHIASEEARLEARSLEETAAGQDQSVIRLENVSVRYRVPSGGIATFKEFMIRRLQGKVEYHSVLALDKVNLTIQRGEIFGLIGNNGAGKSTLLKVVARVLRPTEGRVRVRGRVAPLLEFGAGFHPELTGRENIFLNGTLLGYSHKQMEARFDQIVDFAELWDFIDAPLRTYSSGMWARLGFAVATDVQPDILIVDEVLAVGDEGFQRKGMARIKDFQEKGVTILFVSHNMQVIEAMCQRVAWLDHGTLQTLGPAAGTINLYRQSQSI